MSRPGATQIDRKISSHISSYLCMHNLVPKGQKRPSTRPKASMCTQTSPKGLYLICIICISIYVCISYMYHLHLNICLIVIIPHAYAPKRQKHPNTRPKTSMCVQTGPKGLYLISSHMYHCIWRGRVLSNDFPNNILYTCT